MPAEALRPDLHARITGFLNRHGCGAVYDDVAELALDLQRAEYEREMWRRAQLRTEESLGEARRIATEFRDNHARANPDQPVVPLPWEEDRG